MKGRSLFSFGLNLAILVANCLPGFAQDVNLQTDQHMLVARLPNSIASEIRAKLPRGKFMRLPSSLYALGSRKIYPQVLTSREELIVRFVSEPNCQYGYCLREGSISTSFTQAPFNKVLYLSDLPDSSKTSITLKKGIKGTFVHTRTTEVPIGPTMQVAWYQDGQTYHILFPVYRDNEEQQKQAIINIAVSMASQPPIRSNK